MLDTTDRSYLPDFFVVNSYLSENYEYWVRFEKGEVGLLCD